MFYSVFVLGKKGPLSRVWLAAHWDKKITKAQILETNIVESVESILQPRVRLSLRTSSHLLLGIVRIYSRKTIYLLQDCQDAAFRIKSAYRPGVVDMPQDKCEAAIAAITLPDMMGFEENFDLPLEPPIQIEVLQSNANIRNITLIEEVSSVQVDDPLSMSNVRNWADFSSIPPVGDASRTIQRGSMQGTHIYDGSNPLDMFDRPQIDDGFGGQLGLIDADDLFAIPVAPTEEEAIQEGQMADVQPPPPPEIDEETPIFTGHSDHPQQGAQSVPTPQDEFDLPAENLDGQPEKRMSGQRQRPSLLEDMVLEPLRGSDRKKRRKKRRALGIIFDEVTTMSGDQMTAQMADTKGILMPMNLAPPTKQLMEFKKTGRFEVLFTRPERKLPSKTLLSHFERRLITNRIDVEEPLEDVIGNEEQRADLEFNMPPPDEDQMITEQVKKARTPRSPSVGRSPAKKRKTGVERPQERDADEDALEDYQMTRSSVPELRGSSRRPSEFRDFGEPTLGPEDGQFDPEQQTTCQPPEDMLPYETQEQYDERMQNKRTNVLLQLMSEQLEDEPVRFSRLVRNNKRKQVAQKFFSLLVLHKQQAIILNQDTRVEYAEITVTKGPKYDDAISSSVF